MKMNVEIFHTIFATIFLLHSKSYSCSRSRQFPNVAHENSDHEFSERDFLFFFPSPKPQLTLENNSGCPRENGERENP